MSTPGVLGATAFGMGHTRWKSGAGWTSREAESTVGQWGLEAVFLLRPN